MMFAYCASSVAFARLPFPAACAQLAQCGFEQVDIWSTRNWCEHLPPDDPHLDVEGVRAVLKEHRLSCYAFSLYGRPDSIVQPRLTHLAALGGKVLIRGSGPPDLTVAEFAKQIAPLVKSAEKLGVTLAIENHLDAVICSVASMKELVERIESPALGIAFAPIHVYRNRESIPDAIRTLGKRIAFFYAWDWGHTAEDNWKDPQEQVPGTGQINFRAMLRALADIGYQEPLCVFAHGLEYLPQDRARAGLKMGRAYCQRLESELGL